MKAILTLTLALIALAFLFPPAVLAEDKDTPLAIEMKGMSKDFKQLKKQIADPAQKASSLDLIADMEKHAKAARDLTPANTCKVPPAGRDKWMTEYKQQIDSLIAAYDKLQTAVTGDHLDEARTDMDDILGIKRKGHDEFAKESK